jgi:hypothetical protein
MKKLFIGILIVIIISLIYLSQRQKHTSRTPIQESAINSEKVTCKENDKYFVIFKDDEGYVGEDLLIKYKTEEHQNFNCEYVVEKDDFEIQNNDSAQFFLGLENNSLILDRGTGPSFRDLMIYDLINRKKVFTENYADEAILIENNSITYWSYTNTPATKKNCPKVDEYEGYGGTAGIESRTLLTLSDLKKKELGVYRCTYRQ